ncbi:MAG: formylglycine-generating enzyme family protein [Nitrospina sp.]|nr:formylglycine-generating enzyme family protein [Nitrospina sp.]MBT5632790.1 formylglycine-generating enzyme family protein [Nitrospina sp.]
MRLFKIFFIASIIFLLSSCSEKAEEQTGEEIHPSFSELPEVTEESSSNLNKRVVPIQYSPEDQVKASKAPEGMVFIKGGCFIMGNDYAQEDEKPEHEVCVDDFYLGKYEVTQARWEKVMGFNPSKFSGADLPVEQVNYLNVQKFIQKSEGACRLPTEAEWEYAARGGATTRYYWGNMVHGDYTWYEENSEETTHPVGSKAPNQYGVYDLMGNVWEWVDDWYEPYYKIRSKNNPLGPETGESKVVRGGSFDSSAGALRITNRVWLHPENKVFPKVTTYGQIMNEIFNYIGFRCAKSIPSA